MSRMILPRHVTVDLREFGPWLLAAIVCASFALQPDLYPSRVAPIDTPPKDSTPAEAAPEESPTPPPVAAPQFSAPIAVTILPAESVPDDSAPPAEPGVAISGASGAVTSAATAGGGMARAMTAPGGGKPAARSVQQLSHMIATLSASIKERAAARPANRLAQSHPALPVPETQVRNLPQPAYKALGGPAVSAAAPRPGTLGGPGPFARKVVMSPGSPQMRLHP